MKTKVEPLVNLNINPCKMCMPMGAVTAFYGLQKCITILHGSQGCSTYIRRHMATHYNEPVDVASSSLTEHGTVYGGEDNLLKGLQNLISLYAPQVIGVATTCLAETIGEDTRRIVDKFYELHPEHKNITILPVHSAGYGGTQFNGYFNTLAQIVMQVEMKVEKHQKINVITGILSPADTRYLKGLFEAFGLEIILLPDLSDNLDGGHEKDYDRLPSGGTSIEAVKEMAGSRVTLELCGIPLGMSPGQYLEDTYGVPCKKMNLPVGLRDMDALLKVLSELSGKAVPEYLNRERSRYLDAMVDSHKYNSGGRAVIFGDPDFVLSTVRLCSENGIMPVVVATGSVCPELRALITEEIKSLGEAYFIEEYEILDDVDFKTIETLAVRYGANLLIGNSDGRRIEEAQKIPLVRRGFPIHDRVGGGRLKTLGYEGSLIYLDEMSNALLSQTETTFREALYETYYKEEQVVQTESSVIPTREESEPVAMREVAKAPVVMSIEERTKTHPCYSCNAAHEHARIHLPIAPKCNIQCNYCVRKFDCPNESRPGVTTKVLSPEEALVRYKTVKEKLPNLSVVGIAGPGDALANFAETKRTLELIRAYDPEVTFCLSTNGLQLPDFANDIIALGVTHVTVTLNAVDPKIGAQIYKHVQYKGVRLEGEAAATLLLSNQLSGIRMLVDKGIICKINTVALKGINDHHIPDVVKEVKALGCYISNIMQLIPVEGSAFEGLPMVSHLELNKLRDHCGEFLKQMYHCKQCRADAVGLLGEDLSLQVNDKKTYRFAVASKSGTVVDEHFGHVNSFYIYEHHGEDTKYIEKRSVKKYCDGSELCEGAEEDKITSIIKTIEDCQGVIALRIGESPKSKLRAKGIKVFSTYDYITDAVKGAAKEM